MVSFTPSFPFIGLQTFFFSVNPQADLNVAELPTWVTKVLPGDSEAVSTETPRVPLGKWGHRLEADKVLI